MSSGMTTDKNSLAESENVCIYFSYTVPKIPPLELCFWGSIYLLFPLTNSSLVMTSLKNVSKESGEKASTQPSWRHFCTHSLRQKDRQ